MNKAELPFVSILVATKNEEKYILKCLESLMHMDYPSNRFEVLVIDGKSQDKTYGLVNEYKKNHPNIKLILNEKITLPFARNLGISLSSGEFIVNCDAHALYPSDYVRKLVYYSILLDADNVGGVWQTLPANEGVVSIAIAKILSSVFGVGDAKYRVSKDVADEYLEVDTVPYGCFRKELFEKIGLYDEELTRNQDNELNERILNSGGCIYMVPSIKIKYFARESYKKLWDMFYQYGFFGPLVDIKLGRRTRLRRYIPSIFILSLVLPLPLSFFDSSFLYVAGFSLSLYLIVNLVFSLKLSKEDFFKTLPAIIYAFLVAHLSYGVGYLVGYLKFNLFKYK